MITWTAAAREELEKYVALVRSRFIAEGADADEVAADLERHVEAELAAKNTHTATRDDVRRVLEQMGGLSGEAPPAEIAPAPRFKNWVTMCCWLVGVLTPLAALTMELVTGMAADGPIELIPTWLHVVAIAWVPLVHAQTLRQLKPVGAWPRALVWMQGSVAGITLWYALQLALLTPFALIGILFVGLGLLPLSPLTAFSAALVFRKRMRVTLGDETWARASRRWWWAAALTFAALFSYDVPRIATHVGINMIQSPNPATAQRGLTLLRSIRSESELLAHCGLRRQQASDLISFVFQRKERVSAAQAKTIFYRVTGTPADHATLTPSLWKLDRESGFPRWQWDANRGGTEVGERQRNLCLSESRLDAVVEGEALTSYTEWTMVFKNLAVNDQEARALIQLPPGGVVSRLTLWVEGEEREAAFAGRAQVRAAYQEVVTVQRRDPVLVTSKGAGRVLMQCFPVPRNGGEIKVRVGITAPLALVGAERARFSLPQVIERNFSVDAECKQQFWLESANKIQCEQTALRKDVRHGVSVLRGELPVTSEARPVSLFVEREAHATELLSVHPAVPDEPVRQVIEKQLQARPTEVLLVVDGSATMAPELASVAEAVDALPASVAVQVFFAGDAVEKSPAGTPKDGANWLRARVCHGGQDTFGALSETWERAAEKGGRVILVHGRQPASWLTSSALAQQLSRRGSGVALTAIAAQAGSSVILEKLEELRAGVHVAPRWGTLREDLERELGVGMPEHTWAITRQKVRGTPADFAGLTHETAGHIARLWAADEVARLYTTAPLKRPEATELAARYQLVTPVSGAVVLETKKQFDDAGLKPIDPAMAPTVPEPATTALLLGLLGLTYALWRRRAQRARAGRD